MIIIKHVSQKNELIIVLIYLILIWGTIGGRVIYKADYDPVQHNNKFISYDRQ